LGDCEKEAALRLAAKYNNDKRKKCNLFEILSI
jgi:hypothetical protein